MSADDALERGWARLGKGDLAGAREAARRAAASEPDSPEPLLLEAACAREEADEPGALALLERAARLDPDWATPPLWSAEILAGTPERRGEALRLARRAADLADEEEDVLAASTLWATLELELGNRAATREILEGLPPADVALGEPERAAEIADLWLELGEAGEARARYDALTRTEPDWSDAWHGLGLACEVMGDEAGRMTAWLRALALDEAEPLADADVRLPEEEFVRVAEAALGELPERARQLLRDVPILVSDLPDEDDVRSGWDPRILGMFSGTPYPEQSNVGGGPHLAGIRLFRRNLERMAMDADELREEIRITLLHETGHFFGMSEEDMERVGLD